jgi:hypothetical protein
MAAHAPSVKSAGVFGMMSGSRATHVIADDVEIPNNSATQDMREKLLKAISEFEAIIVPGGRITFLGTPQTEESIYNKLRTRNYECRVWPARVPTAIKLASYDNCLAPSIVERVETDPGQPTDPLRFTDIVLMERQGSMGRSGFALQFMLDTSLSDAEKYPLKLSDLIVMPLNTKKAPILVQYGSSPELQIKGTLANIGFTGDRWYKPLYIDKEWAAYEGAVMSIDPSGRGADETTYSVVKQLHGFLYLLAFGGFKGGYTDDTLIALSKVAKENLVNEVVVEDNFGDGMFSRLLQPVLNRYHRCLISEVKHQVQKERRIIDLLEPVMNRHKLIVHEEAIKQDLEKADGRQVYSLFYQMTRITKDRGALKHDDLVDVLAIAVAYWVEALGKDEEQSVENYKAKELDNMLQEFMDSCLGEQQVYGQVGKNNWMYGPRSSGMMTQRNHKVK